MSVYVLLNVLNELGKRDHMRGLPNILSLFRNEFNKFKSTRARLLNSIYRMIFKLLKNQIFGVINVKIAIFYTTVLRTSFRYVTKSVNH